MTDRRLVTSRALCLGLFTLWTAGCGSTAPPPPTAAGMALFVGPVDGSDALVGLVLEDAQAVLYACGGSTDAHQLNDWFFGKAGDRALTLARAGARVDATIEAAQARGTLTLQDGTVLSFAAERQPDGALGGLYSASADGCRIGAIVRQEAQGPRVVGKRCSVDDQAATVVPIPPLVRRAEGIAVEAGPAQPDVVRFLAPVAPRLLCPIVGC
jgi:hypothetical protein